MKLMTQSEVEEAADQIASWLQDAAGDSVYTDDLDEIEKDFDHIKDIKKLVADARSWPVTDVKGWFADVLYDDPGWLGDMTGDRTHDEGRGDYRNMIAIAECMESSKYSHTALKAAMKKHREDWIERMGPTIYKIIVPPGRDVEQDIEIFVEIPYGIEISIHQQGEGYLQMDYLGYRDRSIVNHEDDIAEIIPDVIISVKGE